MATGKPLGRSEIQEGLLADLGELQRAGRLRSLDVRVSDAGGPDSSSACLDFTSSDYLGLTTHPQVLEAGRLALELHGAGGRASRLLGGGAGHGELEALAAEWLGTESALFYASGYQANLGLLTSLTGHRDVVFSAAANHASIIDGLRLSKARVVLFDHSDPLDLERKLKAHRAPNRRFVVVEGIYSMGGDLAPLAAIDRLCKQHDAHLLVDEAHAVGLIGPEAQGAAAAISLDPDTRLLARTITGGKALGTGGALVVGSRALIDVLLNRSRSFIFSTASTPSLAATLAQSIRLLMDEPNLGARAKANAARLAKRLGLPAPDAAILSVILGDEQLTLDASEGLWELGFDVRAVRPPTVPPGTSRLRVVTHSFHKNEHIDSLAEAMDSLGITSKIIVPAGPSSKALAPGLVIAGTDTDVGKTVAAALVVRALQLGGSVHYWKPVQTGDDSDSATVQRLAKLENREVLRPAWELPLPASPHEAAAEAGVAIQPAAIGASLTELREAHPNSQLVVELAGGLHVPYAVTEGAQGPKAALQIDWLRGTGLPFVLVARSGLGTLNHTLLSLESLRTRHLVPVLILLMGAPHESNARTIRTLADGVPVLEIPHLEDLTPEALDELRGPVARALLVDLESSPAGA